MLTKRQIVTAFNKGFLADVAKECIRYGTISKDKEWTTDSGYYAGAHRVRHVTHYGIQWIIRMHNGEVRSIERNHV